MVKQKGSTTSFVLPLPMHYPQELIFAFHRRDLDSPSEVVSDTHIDKGLLWQGTPARLSLLFNQDRQVEVSLSLDSGNATQAEVTALAVHLLGLNQPISTFEKQFASHPQLGELLCRQQGLYVPQTATAFEALLWAIIGQQISVSAAIAIRRRLINLIGARHHSGIGCFPDALSILGYQETQLRAVGLSQGKAQAILAVSEQIAAGHLPLDAWLQQTPLPVEEIERQLLAIRGIGPWTVNYTLLRGFAWLNGSLHGDVAVRRNLQRLLKREEKLSAKETERWLEQFQPWRALVAAHLWALQSTGGF